MVTNLMVSTAAEYIARVVDCFGGGAEVNALRVQSVRLLRMMCESKWHGVCGRCVKMCEKEDV